MSDTVKHPDHISFYADGEAKIVREERDRIGEILQRSIRTETRMMKLCELLGADVKGEKPRKIVCDGGEMGIEIPSREVRLKDIIALIPGEEGEVPIFINRERIGTITLG